MSLTIGILFFEGTEELDAIGPWEVFSFALSQKDDAKVVTLSESGDTVTCAKGLKIVPDFALADAPALDIVLVPGGMGTRREQHNQALLDWIAKTAANCQWVTSVCTGSLLLYKAGVARGKQVTTHWAFVEKLREMGDITVRDDVRFIRDGNLVTSAGVSAGIDMALWLVGQIYDPDFARAVQKGIEYYPAPPYAAAV